VRGAGRQTGGRQATAADERAREGSTADWGQATRGAHLEHVIHGRDAGRVVKAQRLVERLRALPRVKRRASMRCGARCGPGAVGGAQGMGGAHVEHVAHVRDAGRFESQRLIES